jgi:hypothetical protein
VIAATEQTIQTNSGFELFRSGYSSPRTTKLYDRRTDDISLDVVEKIAI